MLTIAPHRRDELSDSEVRCLFVDAKSTQVRFQHFTAGGCFSVFSRDPPFILGRSRLDELRNQLTSKLMVCTARDHEPWHVLGQSLTITWVLEQRSEPDYLWLHR